MHRQLTNKVPELLLLAILTGFFTMFVGPVVNGIAISFTDWNGLAFKYNYIGFSNYKAMFSDKRFLAAVTVTLWYAMILTVGGFILGYLAAYVVRCLRRTRSLIMTITFFPYMIMPVVACIIWNQMFGGLLPIIGKNLNIGWLQANLLAVPQSALFVVAAVDLWMLVPYVMLLLLAALNAIPEELMEYARLEGASWYQRLVHIELPYLNVAIGTLLIILLSYAMTHIDTLMTLTSGGPDHSTETIYYIIYKNSFVAQKYAFGLAESMTLSTVCIVLLLAINVMFNNRNLSDMGGPV